MKLRLKLILAILGLGMLGGIYGLYLFNKKVPSLESAKADFVLSADVLFDEFDQDEKNALDKYENKIVQVSGKVLSIKSKTDKNLIILKSENAMAGGINCSMKNEFVGVEKGQEVSIKGRCQGFLMDVILNNCNVVKK